MLSLKKEEKLALLIDFDGTITTTDTNDKLVYNHMNDKIKDLLRQEEDMNYIKFMDAVLDEVKITEEQYLKFILTQIGISKGFQEFYNNGKSLNIPITIVSGGFHNGITPFLNKFGITDVDVYANRLNFDEDNLSVTYHDGRNHDCCDLGPCGNCKVQYYEKLKEEGYKVIFIGDGISDQAVARKCDIVFAKDGLEKYCEVNNIEYIPWESFQDINKIIFLDNQII